MDTSIAAGSRLRAVVRATAAAGRRRLRSVGDLPDRGACTRVTGRRPRALVLMTAAVLTALLSGLVTASPAAAAHASIAGAPAGTSTRITPALMSVAAPAGPAGARPVIGGPGAVMVVVAVNDLPTIVANLRTWVMGILAALATLFLTIGGVRYVMAGGDPSEVERAKAAFKSAAIGYCLAVIAPVVLTVLKSIVGS